MHSGRAILMESVDASFEDWIQLHLESSFTHLCFPVTQLCSMQTVSISFYIFISSPFPLSSSLVKPEPRHGLTMNQTMTLMHLYIGPVCLCEFRGRIDGMDKCKMIRILKCGHALCAECLEAWAVHCTKAFLNPSRFGLTRSGRVVSWTPGPKCPICCARLNCVPNEDLREAVMAAITHGGVALSTHLMFPSLPSPHVTLRDHSHNSPNRHPHDEEIRIPTPTPTNVTASPRWYSR